MMACEHACGSTLGVLRRIRGGTGPSSRVRARARPVQHLLHGGYRSLFNDGRRHHGRLSASEEENAGGGAGVRTAVETALATSLWDMLYADDAGFISQSPEQLRKLTSVIVVVCAEFGLTVSEAKTEVMCLRTKGMPEPTAIFSVEAII